MLRPREPQRIPARKPRTSLVNTPDTDPPLPADVPVGFWRRVAYILGPAAVCAAALGVVYLIPLIRGASVADAERAMYEVLVAGGVSLFGAGSMIIFGKAALGDQMFSFNLDSWHLAVIFVFINGVSTFFYTYNLDLLQRLPKIGPYMRLSRRNAVETLKHRPWIRRWAVVGVSLFVVTPLPGSGALGGALMGRITGLTKRVTVTAVTVAGVVIGCAYAFLAREIEQALDRLDMFFPAWVRLGVFLLAAFLMIWLMAKLVRWFAVHPSEADGHETDPART